MDWNLIRLMTNITNPQHVCVPEKSGKPRDWTEEMVFRTGLYIVDGTTIVSVTEGGALKRRENPSGFRALLANSHQVTA